MQFFRQWYFAGRGMNGRLPPMARGSYFEGGQQQPLAMRLLSFLVLPSTTTARVRPVNVARLNALFADGETVDAETLAAKGVISTTIPVKVLVTASFLTAYC